jgi:hypothetical protein
LWFHYHHASLRSLGCGKRLREVPVRRANGLQKEKATKKSPMLTCALRLTAALKIQLLYIARILNGLLAIILEKMALIEAGSGLIRLHLSGYHRELWDEAPWPPKCCATFVPPHGPEMLNVVGRDFSSAFEVKQQWIAILISCLQLEYRSCMARDIAVSVLRPATK